MVGVASQFNEQDFFRDNVQFAYNIFGENIQHDLHAGYQWYTDAEDLLRGSNGWGSLSVPGGRIAPPAGFTQRPYYQAVVQQQSFGQAANIRAPRTIDEVLLGTGCQFTPNWSARLYGRYRHGRHFWEDTNNNGRTAFNAPADIEAKGLYIPNLDDQRRQIGNGSLSGSSYVIAELDNAYTDYHEVTLESEWRGRRAFVRGSYYLEPVLRHARPGQFDGQQRPEHLHRVVEHRRRRGPAALGPEGRPPARRSSAHAQGLRVSRAAVAGDGRSLLRRAVGAAVGAVEFRALQRTDGQHQRHNPVCGAGRQPPVRHALPRWT